MKLVDNVKYIAIGDSISAGFNSEIGFEIPGNLENNTLLGLSYPSFLVYFIKKIKPNIKIEYDNFSITATTIDDWLFLLGEKPKNYNIQKSKEFFNFVLNIDKEPKNPFKGRIESQFNKFLKDDLIFFQNKIKNANLITISLGANDFLNEIPFKKLRALFFASKNEKIEKYQSFLQEVEKISLKIRNKAIVLIEKIKKINPSASINWISYPLPLIKLNAIIDNLLTLDPTTQVISKIVDSINSNLKKAAKENKINFIDIYDENKWLKYNNKLIYYIHPTEIGYKKMAQNIILKLSLSKIWNSFQKSEKEIKNLDYKYFKNDFKLFKRVFDFNLSNEEIIQKILGDQEESQIFELTSLEENQNKLLKKEKNQIAHVIRNWVKSNNSKIEESLPLLLSMLKNSTNFEEYQYFLKTFSSDGKSNFYKIINIFATIKYIPNLFQTIKIDLENNIDLNEMLINRKNFIKNFNLVFKSYLFNENNLIELMKDFAGNNFIKENNEIICKMLIDIFWHQIKPLVSFAVKKDKFINFIMNLEELKNMSYFFLKDIFSNFNNYKKVKSLKDVILIFLKFNKNQIIDFVNKLNEKILDSNLFLEFFIKISNIKRNLNNISIVQKFFKYFLSLLKEFNLIKYVLEEYIKKIKKIDIKIIDLNAENILKFIKNFNIFEHKILFKILDQISSNEKFLDAFIDFFNIIFEEKQQKNSTKNIQHFVILFLRNLSNNENQKNKLTFKTLFLFWQSKIGRSINIIVKRIYHKLEEYKINNQKEKQYKNPYEKMLFRFLLIILWYAYENYAKRSKMKNLIFWNNSPFSIEALIYKYFTSKANNELKEIVNIFWGNRNKILFLKTKKFSKKDLLALITKELEKDPFNIEQINQDRIFKYIKQGFSDD